MTTFGTTDYSSIVTKAQEKVDELLKLINIDSSSETTPKNASGNSSSYTGPDIGNILNGSVNNITTLIEGTDQQKSVAIQNIINDLLNLLSNIGTGANRKAKKEVKDNDKKIEENKKSAEETSREISEKVQNILNDCETNATNIAEAIALIQKMGGDQGEITKAQTKLEEQLKIIEENKAILTSDKSASEKKNALINILNASKAISELVEQVASFKEQIIVQNSVVEENSTQIAELSTDSAEAISEGVKKMQESLVNAGILTQEQATLSIKSAKSTATGTAQKATGQAMTSNAITAAEGAKYIISGNDKMSAGTTLMQGATQGLSKLTASIGEMGQYLTLFTEFGNGLGSFTQGVVQLVGQYDQAVNPIIESIGSWDAIAQASSSLEQYTQEYSKEALGQEVTLTIAENNSKKIEAGDIKNADENNMKFKEFKFDTSIFNTEEK